MNRFCEERVKKPVFVASWVFGCALWGVSLAGSAGEDPDGGRGEARDNTVSLVELSGASLNGSVKRLQALRYKFPDATSRARAPQLTFGTEIPAVENRCVEKSEPTFGSNPYAGFGNFGMPNTDCKRHKAVTFEKLDMFTSNLPYGELQKNDGKLATTTRAMLDGKTIWHVFRALDTHKGEIKAADMKRKLIEKYGQPNDQRYLREGEGELYMMCWGSCKTRGFVKRLKADRLPAGAFDYNGPGNIRIPPADAYAYPDSSMQAKGAALYVYLLNSYKDLSPMGYQRTYELDEKSKPVVYTKKVLYDLVDIEKEYNLVQHLMASVRRDAQNKLQEKKRESTQFLESIDDKL
ncbi:MAG: hypothetical protein KDH88_10055 [Chromatiales bacterium]|nr:hypothetical protein [Chromatiales bacterium]